MPIKKFEPREYVSDVLYHPGETRGVVRPVEAVPAEGDRVYHPTSCAFCAGTGMVCDESGGRVCLCRSRSLDSGKEPEGRTGAQFSGTNPALAR